MPVITKAKNSSKGLRQRKSVPARKPAGTRVGVMADWRGAAKGSGEKSRLGRTVRDGR